MKPYHRAMHTTYLCLSAVLFQCAASLLGRAAHHKGRMRNFGVHTPSGDATYHTIIKSPNVWIDAHPDDYFEE